MRNKICIFHDTFLYKGGGERLILMMGKIIGADIASGFFSAGSFDLRKEGFSGKMIPVSSEVFKKGFRHIRLKFAFLYRTNFLKEYETVIFSGDSISAQRSAGKAKRIYYCHTPPRYLYDLHDLYKRKVPWYVTPFFLGACYVFRKMYERDIESMDLILTNSYNTQKRIQQFLGKKSQVLYPPVDREKFRYIQNDNYFLSFARLADAKRVDRIVEAFTALPDQKLLVIYGKNDPQREKVFELGRGHANIEFRTLEDNNALYEIIGKSRASIYIPIDEDFGMSPVESMSAGKPVIGVNEGGLRETVIHEKTGYLIQGEPTSEKIIQAVIYMSGERSEQMRRDCEKRSEKFSLLEFSKQLHEHIQ